MQSFKTYLSIFFTTIVLSIAVNIHGLSHIVENDLDDDTHCEVCFVHAEHSVKQLALQPTSDLNISSPVVIIYVKKVKLVYKQVITKHSFKEKFLNKPPPSIV